MIDNRNKLLVIVANDRQGCPIVRFKRGDKWYLGYADGSESTVLPEVLYKRFEKAQEVLNGKV